MRLLLAALAGFALAVVPALAAEHSVTATSNAFTPKDITIAPGDSVTWTQSEGNHTVHFDGQPAGNPLTTPYERTFDTAGSYLYYCDPHGGPGGEGMSGKVVVKSPDTTGATTQTTQTTTQTTTTQTTTTQTTTTAPSTTPPPVVSVKATGSRFCVRRSRRCRRPGVVLRITSDTPHQVTGTLRRGGVTFGSVEFDVPAGTKTVRFARTSAGRRLARGRYALKLGTAPTVRFRVR